MSFGFGLSLPAYPLRGGGGNNPFNQDGATLDLSFVGTAGDLSGADTYTLNTDFITPEYQVAAQYAVWENGVGLAQKTFSQIVTFTRASTATYFNSAGTLTTATTNEARFDYNPSTLVPLGFLIEEQRTNSIRNNTMQGAVAGTPGTLPTNWVTNAGGLSYNVIGTGIENGVAYIDFQFVGTTASTAANLRFEGNTSLVAANGQTWTSTFFVRQISGSTTNITGITNTIYYRDGAGTILTQQDASIAGTLGVTLIARNRVTNTFTAANASTAFVNSAFQIGFGVGVAIDITLRIGLPQLEQGAFATSVIPTTTTALTRSADVASVNTLSPWYNASAGTLYAEYQPVVTAQTLGGVSFSDGTNNNRMIIRAMNTSSETRFIGSNGGVIQWNDGFLTATATATKSAFAYATNDIASTRNGATPVADTLATIPTVDRLVLGADADQTAKLNGYLRRITYYPRRLPNADLQTITA